MRFREKTRKFKTKFKMEQSDESEEEINEIQQLEV